MIRPPPFMQESLCGSPPSVSVMVSLFKSLSVLFWITGRSSMEEYTLCSTQVDEAAPLHAGIPRRRPPIICQMDAPAAAAPYKTQLCPPSPCSPSLFFLPTPSLPLTHSPPPSPPILLLRLSPSVLPLAHSTMICQMVIAPYFPPSSSSFATFLLFHKIFSSLPARFLLFFQPHLIVSPLTLYCPVPIKKVFLRKIS